MIAIDKFIQIVRLCGDSIGISISIGIDIGIVIDVIFLGRNICYYLILDVFSSLDSLFAEIYIESAYSESLIFPEPYSRVIACVFSKYVELNAFDTHVGGGAIGTGAWGTVNITADELKIKGIRALIGFLKSDIYFVIFHKSDD